MIKVTCEVEDFSEPRKPSIKVHSHWSDNLKVEIEIDGVWYTVIGKDLIEAVKNCTNTARW